MYNSERLKILKRDLWVLTHPPLKISEKLIVYRMKCQKIYTQVSTFKFISILPLDNLCISSLLKNIYIVRCWWCMPLVQALRRQMQADLCEFEARLVYKRYFQDRLQSYRETLSLNTKQKCLSLLSFYLVWDR